MQTTIVTTLKDFIRGYDKPHADPEFYDAKRRCRDVARMNGDDDPMLMFHSASELLYVSNEGVVNLAS